MPDPTSVSLPNYGFQADASRKLLTVMLNCPEIDYSTAEELHHCIKLSHFTQVEIDNALRWARKPHRTCLPLRSEDIPLKRKSPQKRLQSVSESLQSFVSTGYLPVVVCSTMLK